MKCTVEQIISEYLDTPDVEIQLVGEGEVNYVYRVGNTVFRIPKTDFAKLELLHEAQVTKLANDVWNRVAGIEIPVYEYIHPEGKFAVVKYVEGKTYDENEMRSWPKGTKEKLASQIVHAMNTLAKINTKTVEDLMDKSSLDQTYSSVDKLIRDRYEQFGVGAEDVYLDIESRFERYCADYPDGIMDEKRVVVHGDTHDGNILFDNDHNLVGIIDFADMKVANLNYELRNLSGLGIDFVTLVVSKLDDRFGSYDEDAFLNMCILYEMLVSLRYIKGGREKDQRFEDSINYLKQEGISA